MRQGVLISTTEHLLAALYCCGIDNIFVELDALELPILDGSSQPFIEILARAGTRSLRRQRRYIRVVKPLEFSDGDRRIGIYPADEFSVQCFVDYHHPSAGPQKLELTVSRDTFSRELAPARTFTFVKELEALRKMGLIRGGSLANAIVMDDQCILNGPLRFADEFVRHKALDLIGDMALVGQPLLGRIVAHKAGHALHTQLVTRLLADHSLWKETTQEHAPAASYEREPLPVSLAFGAEAD
jgi:UDP-3-O-[3-hydroxymyristoyl] N-acetylglucosamine deacetylase